MFWGVALESGRRYSQVVESTYHISMAALEPSNKTVNNSNKSVSLMLEHGKTEFLLCTLEYNRVMQVALDLNFVEGEEVTFYVNGEGTIHLTGYIVDEHEEDEAASESDDEVAVEKNTSVKKGSPKGKTAELLSIKAEEDDEEEDEDWVPPPEAVDAGDTSKRKKMENGDAPLSKKVKMGPSAGDKSKANIPKGSSTKLQMTLNQSDSDEDDEEGSDDDSDANDLVMGSADEKSEDTASSEGGSDDSEEDDEWGSDDQNQSDTEIPTSNKKGKQGQNQQATKVGAQQFGKNSLPNTSQTNKGSQKKLDPFSSKSPASAKKQTPDSKSPMNVLQGGVKVHDLVEGKGPEAVLGKKVHVYYVGRLASNNKEFDSHTKGTPFNFKLGGGDVIKGWDVAIKGMKVGGKRKVIIPPAMGYGAKRVGDIPPNSSLQFDIELKSVSK